MIPGDLVGWPAISLAVLVPIVTNPLSMLVARSLGYRRGAFISHVSMLVPLLIVLYFLPDVLSGKAFKEEYPWVLPLGLELGFLRDSTSYPFALLITIMGFLSSVYSAAYMEKEHRAEPAYGCFSSPILHFFHSSFLGVRAEVACTPPTFGVVANRLRPGRVMEWKKLG